MGATGNLVVFADNIDGRSKVQIQYRKTGSNGAFTLVQPAQTNSPFSIPNVENGEYEVQVRSLCSNGTWSAWTSGKSPACTLPGQFTASIDSTKQNFLIISTVAAAQAGVEIRLQDPNGGISNVQHLGSGQQSFAIPIPSKVGGQWSLSARAICDNNGDTPFVSAYTPSVQVGVAFDCKAPVIADVSSVGLDGGTNAYRTTLTLTGYTNKIRTVIFDNYQGSNYLDTIIDGTSTLSWIFQAGHTYLIQIYNICDDGSQIVSTTNVGSGSIGQPNLGA